MSRSTALPERALAPPRGVTLRPDSAGERAGLQVGDEIVDIDGVVPRDVLEYQQLVDEPDLTLTVRRGGLEMAVEVPKRAGEPLGAEVHTALFDQVRTCDNHCEFCFIYQLPKGLRPSLYLKDDDYRLSFLYGNFTTLTRFTEADLERVVTERLSPLNVSIHTTDPLLRAEMLRTPRGGMSLRWLRMLLDRGIEVHGQIVVCPGINDGDELDLTLAGILAEYAQSASICVVPLGISKFNREARMRLHPPAEARRVTAIVDAWQRVFLLELGRRLVYAADEYYLMTGEPFPPAEAYDGFPMHEDGIGMARAFEAEFRGVTDRAIGVQPGFFAWVDGAPAEGYRAPRAEAPVVLRPRRAPIGILTGALGAQVLAPLVAELDRDDVRVLPVQNDFFGGNTSVTGLMVGADIARLLSLEPAGHRYLLPDVCLSGGRFLDGTLPAELPHPIEIIATDGLSLRRALELR